MPPNILARINIAINNSIIGRFFEFESRGANFWSELRGATATFMSMAYILAVNPLILSESGGPCKTDNIWDPAYTACIEDIRREYVTSTAIASMLACWLMGFLANLPIALAPGMGINAYFTYTVVGFRGTGNVDYEAALTAILIEGFAFLILALTGIRHSIIKWTPEPVRVATPAAIGIFLAFLGLQSSEGLGAVVGDTATLVTLGACPEEKRTPIVALDTCWIERFSDPGVGGAQCLLDDATNATFCTQCIQSGAYTCDELGGVMTSGTFWLGALGLFVIVFLLAYKQRSAFIFGIGFVTIVSWFRNTPVTYFPDNLMGNARFEYFKQVVRVEKLDKVLANFTDDLQGIGIAFLTFLYVDFLDTSGTLYGLVTQLGFVDEDGNFPRARLAFASDAIATIIGSVFGLSPVTSYIESGAGVEAGSKTGLTAVICGFYFLLSIFFAPIIASIPPWATGGALIIVGALMCRSLADVKWWNITHAVSAFLTVVVMPLTYSIAYGLIAGIGSFVILESILWLLSLVGIPKPEFTPFVRNATPVSEGDGDGDGAGIGTGTGVKASDDNGNERDDEPTRGIDDVLEYEPEHEICEADERDRAPESQVSEDPKYYFAA